MHAPVLDLLGVLAHHGHPGDPTAALAALNGGLASLDMAPVNRMPPGDDWPDRLDNAVARLDRLNGGGKQRLLRALVATITHGGETVTPEVELLRAVCATLHMPLPLWELAEDTGDPAPE